MAQAVRWTVLSSMPTKVRPRGLMEAARRFLPGWVRLTNSHRPPRVAQEMAAMKTSFQGVRTPKMSMVEVTRGCTVMGVLVKM